MKRLDVSKINSIGWKARIGLKREIGLLINFGPKGVEVKRKYRKPEESN